VVSNDAAHITDDAIKPGPTNCLYGIPSTVAR
jgi:hypothetical protein